MYISCEASSWTLLHQNRKLSSRISLQNQLFCLCRLPAVIYEWRGFVFYTNILISTESSETINGIKYSLNYSRHGLIWRANVSLQQHWLRNVQRMSSEWASIYVNYHINTRFVYVCNVSLPWLRSQRYTGTALGGVRPNSSL